MAQKIRRSAKRIFSEFSRIFSDLVNPPYTVAKYSILKNYKGDKNDLSIQPIKLQNVISKNYNFLKKKDILYLIGKVYVKIYFHPMIICQI